jgi:IS5 family transposase
MISQSPAEAAPILIHPTQLATQTSIRLPLPIVKGNKDYAEKEKQLRNMDRLLVNSGIEEEFVGDAVVSAVNAAGVEMLSDRRQATVQGYARQTLRCTIARMLSEESLRKFTIHLAESPLLQWFCACDHLTVISVPSKSTLAAMEQSVSPEMLTKLGVLLLKAAQAEDAKEQLGLSEPVDLSMVWMDATCAKLNIHYPTDWVLLRDGTKSLMQAIVVIRKHGLFHRMPDPKQFTRKMNRLCIEMTAASRKGRAGAKQDKQRNRKKTLRTMKRLTKTVAEHAKRYRDMLDADWAETDLSRPQAEVILKRLDTILESLPAAIKQAHERIIGERNVPNDEKILSLYEPHASVYVRGKAGADAEFGLQLFLSESAEGLIIDCQLNENGVINDSKELMPALKRIRKAYGKKAGKGVVTDRGFSSEKNSSSLDRLGIEDATLPRNPDEMAEFLADPKNQALHIRRAQTEARIGIFKAKFIGNGIPTKGFAAQKRYIAWSALAHNLWVLARLAEPVALAEAC